MKIAQNEAVNAARFGQIESTSSATSAPSAGDSSVVTESPAATVSFSSQAQDIAKAKAAVNASPDVREDLVASLKSQIDSGTYKVSGSDVADMMMRRIAADNSAS